jgi:hypothetical protein
MRKPHLGDVVLTLVDSAQNDGSSIAPAMITRVWSDEMVNLRVILDAFTMPLSMMSVRLVDTQGEPRPAPQAASDRCVCWYPVSD